MISQTPQNWHWNCNDTINLPQQHIHTLQWWNIWASRSGMQCANARNSQNFVFSRLRVPLLETLAELFNRKGKEEFFYCPPTPPPTPHDSWQNTNKPLEMLGRESGYLITAVRETEEWGGVTVLLMWRWHLWYLMITTQKNCFQETANTRGVRVPPIKGMQIITRYNPCGDSRGWLLLNMTEIHIILFFNLCF